MHLVFMTVFEERKRFNGVGLINTKDLEKYDTAPAGTLAEVVTSQNKYARQYSNMILGKVQMCERYEDLKKVFCFYHKGLYEISEPCGKCHQTRGISCAVYRQKCFYRTAGTG